MDLSNPDTVTQLGQCGHLGSSYNVALYDHYACLANSNAGLDILDVLNPDSIRQVDTLRLGVIKGVAVAGHYAYAVGDTTLFVIDLSNPETPAVAAALHGIGQTNNLAISDTMAYLVGQSFHIVNIANPLAPVVLGSCPLPQPGWDVAIWRDLAYVADGLAGLRVISLTNPNLPVEFGYYNTRGTSYGITAVQNIVYVADFNYLGRYECLGIPAIVVQEPNSAIQWSAQTMQTISWITAGLGANVNILLNRSYPTGDWQPLFSNIANTGTIAWTVTGPHSHECRIRVESVDDASVFDISNADFMVSRGLMNLRSQTMAFGHVPLDSTVTQSLWIWNTGVDFLEIEYIVSSDPHFGLPFSWEPIIAPGDSSAVVIGFSPDDTLNYSARIMVYSSAGDSTITCRGDGLSLNSVSLPGDLPREYRLYPPYPNPFNVSTTLAFDLPQAGPVILRVFDLLGRSSLLLSDGALPAGNHRVVFDGSILASGIYFVRLDAGPFTQTMKLTLLK